MLLVTSNAVARSKDLTEFVRSCRLTNMEPDRGELTLESALAVVLRDLRDAEQDLDRATFRVHHAREAATSLQALVGPTMAAQIAEQVGVSLPARRVQGAGMEAATRRALERRQAMSAEAKAKSLRDAMRQVAAGDAERERADRNARVHANDAAVAQDSVEVEVTQVAEGADQVEDASSTERVVQLLREYEGKAIPRAMILEQFEKRGWVDPSWSHPGPAIRMAIRRATEKGAAKLVGDGRYMYADPGLLGDLPSGGDA